MKNVCIVTAHPFWSEPLGCGSLMRSRYEALSRICNRLYVLYITRSANSCPLPNGRTLRVTGDFTEEHVDLVRDFIAQEKIATCFFSYNVFDQLAERLPCRTVVEIHDVLHLRQQNFEAHGYKAPAEIGRDEELRSLARFDAVVCINRDEANYLAAHGVAGVSYLPPTGAFRPVPGPQAEPVPGVIGSSALPNVDGLKAAIEHLRKLPRLVVAGSLSEHDFLAGVPNVERLGVLPDVGAFYAGINVALSPVRFGGGLKIKVFEALANGKPVVATSHSVEGFPDGIRGVVRVEDDFSRWTVELMRDALSTPPSDIADYFVEHFSPERCREAMLAVI